MINAIQELARAPAGKQLDKLALSVSSFLLTCYRDNGIITYHISVVIYAISLFL